jgi:hypothetical protein
MIFNALDDAAQRGELILVDGGLCHYHLRRDGILTIREIIVLPASCQGRGIGRAILDILRDVPGAVVIRAKCPAELPANGWYRAVGFKLAYVDQTRAGGRLYVWELKL